MSTVQAMIGTVRCGPPIGSTAKRPSVEYTGKGEQLCYDGWGGRWFRSSEEAVLDGCQSLIAAYVTDGPDTEGAYVNYSNLYELWGITESDMGFHYGWSPSEDYRVDLDFTLEHCGPGSSLFDVFHEDVLLITPSPGCEPDPYYMEV